jgi:hypothetical protein
MPEDAALLGHSRTAQAVRSNLCSMATSTASIFGLPDDALVLVQPEVLDGAACRVVERAADGQWSFLDRPRRQDTRHLRRASLDGLVRGDQGLVLVADLAPGWLAWRTARGGAWSRTPIGDAYHEVPPDPNASDFEFVFAVDEHELGFLQRLWISLTWRWRRREILSRMASMSGDSWNPPGPDQNGPEGSGTPIPRRPPDGSLVASAAVPEPTRDGPSEGQTWPRRRSTTGE